MLLFLGIALAGGIGTEFGKEVSNKYISKKQSETIETSLKKEVVKIHKTLPKKIDDVTTYTKVDSSGSKIMYFFVIDKNIKDLDKEIFHNQISEQLSHDLCSKKDVIYLFEKGVTFAYHYEDKKGSLIDILEFNINTCDTKKTS